MDEKSVYFLIKLILFIVVVKIFAIYGLIRSDILKRKNKENKKDKEKENIKK